MLVYIVSWRVSLWVVDLQHGRSIKFLCIHLGWWVRVFVYRWDVCLVDILKLFSGIRMSLIWDGSWLTCHSWVWDQRLRKFHVMSSPAACPAGWRRVDVLMLTMNVSLYLHVCLVSVFQGEAELFLLICFSSHSCLTICFKKNNAFSRYLYPKQLALIYCMQFINSCILWETKP